MDAPGSRHNAECKRRRKAFEAQNGPESASSPSASTEMHSPSTPEKFVDAPVDGGTSTQGKESETRIDVDGDTNMPEVESSSPTPVGDMGNRQVLWMIGNAPQMLMFQIWKSRYGKIR